MSDGASTSKECEAETDKNKLLQQALSEAGAKRAQQRKMKKQENGNYSSLEDQKSKIRQHPLMPVLKLLLEKCELASSSMHSHSFQMEDVVQLLTQMDISGINIKTDDPEVDEVMVNGIIALRTQLAELQKVSTLAESFYTNYSTKLRKRVNQEALIGSSNDSDEEGGGTPTPEGDVNRLHATSLATITTANGMMTLPLRLPPHPLNFFQAASNQSQRPFLMFQSSMIDTSSSLPMPFTSMPFFSIPHLQGIQMQSNSGNEESQE